ncbi:hypothetical protein JYT26_01955, partial [Beggiatoa alba]|nr:hypothetical protein [Beggiatoa alba]
MNIGFYILGKKGYVALCEFVKYFGSDSVAFVVAARDGSIENDWYSEIIKMNHANGLNSFTRNEFNNDSLPNSDFNFAIGWRWLIKEPANLVVFHDSLLPKYRGFSPLVNMLIDGCDEIGVTALIASDEYDKGAIIYQSRKKITYPLKISDAIEKIIPLYTELAIKIAEDIKSDGDLNVFPQDES